MFMQSRTPDEMAFITSGAASRLKAKSRQVQSNGVPGIEHMQLGCVPTVKPGCGLGYGKGAGLVCRHKGPKTRLVG